MTSDVEALRRVRFFEELTDDDLARVAKVGQRRGYEAGEALVERDSDRGGLFVLRPLLPPLPFQLAHARLRRPRLLA